ncbi:hypothetical protein TNIN_111241 [Trichonephila inaurata madagascariensis]|uniref:Uncharacterized protein n=1 Tax=Trichonephila inaurata madagascariensis TaxID=2747483 RepID=A0A8X6XLA2_9ARAC|nr:hypothetical protein TNIN_111241 [Trichonephila inaurata madagascariensis]
MTLMSGECGVVCNCCFQRKIHHILTLCVMCLESLPCWKMNTTFSTLSIRSLRSIFRCTIWFIMLTIKTKFPTPDEAMQPRAMTEPPPWLRLQWTVKMWKID